jgi:hypothetical protein
MALVIAVVIFIFPIILFPIIHLSSSFVICFHHLHTGILVQGTMCSLDSLSPPTTCNSSISVLSIVIDSTCASLVTLGLGFTSESVTVHCTLLLLVFHSSLNTSLYSFTHISHPTPCLHSLTYPHIFSEDHSLYHFSSVVFCILTYL